MTRQAPYKRNEPRNRGTLLSVLICLVLALLIFSGLLKTFKFPGHNSSKSYSWDKQSSFAVALETEPPSVLVFQKDPSRIIFLTVDKNLYFERGSLKSIKQISSAMQGRGKEFSDSMSLVFGVPIKNYVKFSKVQGMDNLSAKQLFKSFASLGTPFVILTGGKPSYVKDTNITRSDALSLWWQAKSLSINDIKLADLSGMNEEILAGNTKVLGADTLSINREIGNYLDNPNIEKDGYKIIIVNESQNPYSGVVAARFVSVVGGNVISTEDGAQRRQKCQIVVDKPGDYTPSYLANMLGCDISNLEIKGPNGHDKAITIYLGQDFSERYFQ